MLDRLSLDQIRMFVAIAEAGSFRAGAARLSRAQSAISHAIGNLEAGLGVALFDRGSHRPTLTAEGQTLLADARAVLLKVDLMRARARGLGEGVELVLSLIIDTWFPIATVGAALRNLREAYPSVSVRVQTAPLGGPIEALRERRCALAITVSEDFRDPQIELEALSTVAVIPVAAAMHPLAQREKDASPLHTAELAEHLQILLEDPSELSAGREFGVLSPGTWRVTEQATKHALIQAGLGWGRLPLWTVQRDLDEGRLVQLPAVGLGPEGEITRNAYLAHRIDEPLGPAAKSLRSALFARAHDDGGSHPRRGG
jgi:DNA-binding transcriptional LysR family regulator